MAGIIFDEKKKKEKGNIFCLLTMLFLLFGNLFAPLEILKGKRKVSTGFISIVFSVLILFLTGFAQQTNNLEVIWVKTAPSDWEDFGSLITSGDLNGDGFSDIVIRGWLQGSATSAYIFYGGLQFDTIPDLIITSSGGFGFAIHSGDINGDSFDDLILGQQHLNRVSIYLGGNPMNTICDYVISGQDWGCFGVGISTGDVNGDGYRDLIVGDPGAYLPPVFEFAGRVSIFYGGPNFDTIRDIILNGGHHNDQEGFGSSVSGSGDVNNDGFSDVIVGAYSFGLNLQGRIYIYYGGNPMDTSYDVAMMGEQAGGTIGEFGVDFIRNYQTFDYAITGTPLWGPSGPAHSRGKIYVLFGGNPMDSIPDVCIIGRTPTSSLGLSFSGVRFISAQMSEAIAVGAPEEEPIGNDSMPFGCAYLWLGEPNLDTIPDAWLRGNPYNEGIGWGVTSAGDVDGDGRDEIMISNAAFGPPKRVWVCKYTGVGIDEEHQPLTAVRLPLEVYPNPARTQVAIRLPQTLKSEMLNQVQHDKVAIKIYDVSGKLVKRLDKVDSRQNTGYREIRWDLRDERQKRLANGIYFVELVSEQGKENLREIRKIVVTK